MVRPGRVQGSSWILSRASPGVGKHAIISHICGTCPAKPDISSSDVEDQVPCRLTPQSCIQHSLHFTIAPRHVGQPAPSRPCKDIILASDLHLAETLLLVSHSRFSPRTSAYVGPLAGLHSTRHAGVPTLHVDQLQKDRTVFLTNPHETKKLNTLPRGCMAQQELVVTTPPPW